MEANSLIDLGVKAIHHPLMEATKTAAGRDGFLAPGRYFSQIMAGFFQSKNEEIWGYFAFKGEEGKIYCLGPLHK